MSVEREEPWGRVVVQVAWRFVAVAVAVGLVLAALLGRIDTPLFVACALGGPTAIVEGCVRAGRGRSERAQRLLLGLSWAGSACWVLGCLLQGTYVHALAARGPEAAWAATWDLLTGSEVRTVFVVCAVATSGAPVLVFARRAAESVREQIALAAVPAVLLAAGPILLHAAVQRRGALGFSFGIAAASALLAVAAVALGAVVLRALDALEARHLSRRGEPDPP